MAFRLGQRMACVEDWNDKELYPAIYFPEKGKTYTIRGMPEAWDGKVTRTGLWLVEIHNILGPQGQEYCFDPEHFRPLVARKTSIEIFQRMLTPDLERVR
jgi:hypothetical protein